MSIIQLAEQCNSPPDPMFLFQGTVQVQIEYEISGMACGAELSPTLGRFVQRTFVGIARAVLRSGHWDQSVKLLFYYWGYARQGIGANSIFLKDSASCMLSSSNLHPCKNSPWMFTPIS